MLMYMISKIIRDTFLKEVGKFQGGKPEPKAMLLSFSMPTQKGEEGYRHSELLIYAPANYVAVFEREGWNVIQESDLEYDEESGEDVIKEGCDYNKGSSPWVLLSYHDSCWSDAIEGFFRKCKDSVAGFHGSDWYKIVDINRYELPDDFRGK